MNCYSKAATWERSEPSPNRHVYREVDGRARLPPPLQGRSFFHNAEEA